MVEYNFYGHPATADQVARHVGPGWRKLILDLLEKLEALGWDGGLQQVKEKFGTLRFYWSNNIEGIHGSIAEDVVSQAEDRSSYTCEKCGEFGELRGSGWVVTRCTKCWEEERNATLARDVS